MRYGIAAVLFAVSLALVVRSDRCWRRKPKSPRESAKKSPRRMAALMFPGSTRAVKRLPAQMSQAAHRSSCPKTLPSITASTWTKNMAWAVPVLRPASRSWARSRCAAARCIGMASPWMAVTKAPSLPNVRGSMARNSGERGRCPIAAALRLA